MRTGHWFDPKYSFRGSMISLYRPVALKEYCMEHFIREFQESMDSCTGSCNATEIMLPGFSPLPTMFSKGFFLRVVKSQESWSDCTVTNLPLLAPDLNFVAGAILFGLKLTRVSGQTDI